MVALEDRTISPVLLVTAATAEHFRSVTPGVDLLVEGSGSPDPRRWLLGPLRSLRRSLARSAGRAAGWPRDFPAPPRYSDGLIESRGIDVMHFTTQQAFVTRLPSIYQPHDLQHLHLPGYFSLPERLSREVRYSYFCRNCSAVVAASTFVREDVIRHYQIDPARVYAVAYGPPTATVAPQTDAHVAATIARLGLPDRFAMYPAQTFPHKGHASLISAIAHLRDSHALSVPLVLPGRRTEHAAALDALIERYKLGSLVRFLGFVSEQDLSALYRRAACTVIPTHFEAASFPMIESFSSGVPVATSTVTSLPAQAGGAALLFAKDDVPAMAECIRRLWTDAALAAELVTKGRTRIAEFTWQRTARHFCALYRRIGGRAALPGDAEMLDGPPML